MLSRYRDEVRAWSDPVGRTLFRLRLRPNHLTVMGLAVSLLAAAAFIAGHTQSAGVLLIVAGLFDLFDGSLARASGQVTAFGAFLDSVIAALRPRGAARHSGLFARRPTRGALSRWQDCGLGDGQIHEGARAVERPRLQRGGWSGRSG